ncbi:hypothetical protein Tco_0846293 [Tanacetum coccineum]
MITEEMKHTEHYRMYTEVFGRSTRLTPPAPVPTVDKAAEMILQDTLQISLAEHKSREEQEARENVELVNKHLTSEEIEKMMKGSDNVIVDSLPQIPGTRLEPKSDKESLEVESTNDEEVEVTNVVIPVNVNEEEDEITDEVYELKRREKGKIVEESRSTPFPIPIRSLRTHTDLVSSDTEKLLELTAEISSQIQKAIDNHIPSQVDASQQDITIWLALQMKFESLQVPQTTCRSSAVRPRDQDDPHDDAHPEGENHAKRQKTSEYEAYVSRESSSGQKMVDEMLRQRCTSGDEHQYHIDQMKNFLKSDIVWESRKEILVSPHPRKTTPLVQSCQRDPEAPPLSLINQDLLYLKKGSSGPEKIVLSLHKFPAIIFNDDDIEERTSRWVNKKQKEAGKPKEVIYSNSKIIQVIKTYWELGLEHKFITEIVARRANGCIVSITKPDYKNLNKNDIEDMYLLIMNGKVPDYAEIGLLWSLLVFIRSLVIWERVHDFQLGIESYQRMVNLTAPTISFPGVEKHKMFSIIYEPVHGIIYKNSKKEKRVMRHSKIHKDLTNEVFEYLKLFEEVIGVRLKYRNQMRRWEMYVNGRPLGP